MNDMSRTIIPKSDQLNADDLLTGPITITITGVNIRAGQEQPVSISYEGDNGKPYKACKSMCRVMVSVWGADASKYVGRSMTLFCDPKVRWGGMEVGGIRISHMSDIDSAITMALTVTKANKKPFTVKPLVKSLPPPASPVTTPVTPPACAVTEAAGDQLKDLPPLPEVYKNLQTAYDCASMELKGRFDLRIQRYKTIKDIPLAIADQVYAWIRKEIDKGAQE